MVQRILNLKGATLLSATEQKTIAGGRLVCFDFLAGTCRQIAKGCGEVACQPLAPCCIIDIDPIKE